MKLYKNMANNVVIALEIHYFHMNMNGLDFDADITQMNENMNSLKFNGRK